MNEQRKAKWWEVALWTLEYFYGQARSCWIVRFRSIKRPAIFYGGKAEHFAIRYAHKRHNRWEQKWGGDGRIQGILMYGETKLVVCSEPEVVVYQQAGIIPRNVLPRNVIKRAIYNTKRGRNPRLKKK